MRWQYTTLTNYNFSKSSSFFNYATGTLETIVFHASPHWQSVTFLLRGGAPSIGYVPFGIVDHYNYTFCKHYSISIILGVPENVLGISRICLQAMKDCSITSNAWA